MKTNFIILFLLLAWFSTGCSGSGSSDSGVRADSLIADSLTTDSINIDSLSAEQCGARLAELEIQALLTMQQKGETSVAATRATATMNRTAAKIIERFQTDTLAQKAFNEAYEARYAELIGQYQQLKDYIAANTPTENPAQLGMLGAEMEIMTKIAELENGKDSEEYKKAEADMNEYCERIIELYRENPTAQEIYLQAYAAHYKTLAEQLTSKSADAQ